jgi:DNA mismatch repair ATPase MutS
MDILDFHPTAGDDEYIAKYGVEPSLRELVHKYYKNASGVLSDLKIYELYKEYCRQIEEALDKLKEETLENSRLDTPEVKEFFQRLNQLKDTISAIEMRRTKAVIEAIESKPNG